MQTDKLLEAWQGREWGQGWAAGRGMVLSTTDEDLHKFMAKAKPKRTGKVEKRKMSMKMPQLC